jgi:hypothetical protein
VQSLKNPPAVCGGFVAALKFAWWQPTQVVGAVVKILFGWQDAQGTETCAPVSGNDAFE